MRQAIAERIELSTQEQIVFDCGFGFIPDNRGGVGTGYILIFKARSPILGAPALSHPCVLIGDTPDDDKVREIVETALADLQEQAAQQLTMPR